MKTNSIGIFDSGLGGLTAMRHIRTVLPHENILYFGDTARLPYGNKSPDTIIGYCMENVAFLLEQQIKVLVVACHTACTAALDILREQFDIPIIGIMEQGIDEVILTTQTQKIAIAGTRTTIDSGVYQKRIRQRLPSVDIHAIACPLFVPLVEEGYSDHPIASLIINEYLRSLKDSSIDTLLLGCTHYPLLLPLIGKELGSSIALIDPACRCAQTVFQLLTTLDLLNPQSNDGHCAFFVSDDPTKFQHLGKTFLNYPIVDISCVQTKV